MKGQNLNKIIGWVLVLVIIFIIGAASPMGSMFHGGEDMMTSDISMENMEEHRMAHVSHEGAMIKEMMGHSKYRCCLEHPCSSCATLTPWHGEGAECDCLTDVVEGKYPCGECAGGILAGRGNKYLAQYFAISIADGIGQHYLDDLRQTISEKYEISIEEQI